MIIYLRRRLGKFLIMTFHNNSRQDNIQDNIHWVTFQIIFAPIELLGLSFPTQSVEILQEVNTFSHIDSVRYNHRDKKKGQDKT